MKSKRTVPFLLAVVLYKQKQFCYTKGGYGQNGESCIEPEVKEQAESILSALGIPVSNAINLFYKQIILQRGLPFELKLPQEKLVDMSKLSAQELDMELEKGYQDVLAGRTRPADEVFEEIRKDY